MPRRARAAKPHRGTAYRIAIPGRWVEIDIKWVNGFKSSNFGSSIEDDGFVRSGSGCLIANKGDAEPRRYNRRSHHGANHPHILSVLGQTKANGVKDIAVNSQLEAYLI
ncbi:hypothetical protein [Mycolicibacterium stellerae]|uniref:hypothetical protein n=1 Tax=Mycolicibacterium stellerae TaxID=2358193 RepID=UPI0013DE0CF5